MLFPTPPLPDRTSILCLTSAIRSVIAGMSAQMMCQAVRPITTGERFTGQGKQAAPGSSFFASPEAQSCWFGHPPHPAACTPAEAQVEPTQAASLTHLSRVFGVHTDTLAIRVLWHISGTGAHLSCKPERPVQAERLIVLSSLRP